MRKNIILTFLISLFLLNHASASRVYQPMGEYVKQASVIAIVDTSRRPEGWETVLTFREIIRGPANLIGHNHVIPLGNISTGDVHLLPDLKQVAVLLKKNWQKEEQPVLEIYQQPHEIVALKVLARIYELSDEKQRLRALLDAFDDGNAVLQEQLLSDLQHMKEKSNFPLIVELLHIADTATQTKVIVILQRMGDSRAIPALLELIGQTHVKLDVRKSAADALLNTFPGAPGVAEAIQDFPELLPPPPSSQLTVWQKADQALHQGNLQEAKKGFLAIAEDEQESPFTRLSAAQKILNSLSDAERNELRKPLLLLFHDKEARNYLTDRDFVDLFRKLGHPDCLDPLVTLLMQERSVDQTTVITSVMAVVELGDSARKRAATQLLERILDMANGVTSRSFYNGTHPHFLALAWIGHPESHNAASNALKKNRLEEYWKPVIPLLGAADREDEGGYLVEILGQSKNTEVQEWIVFRLGDLREKRAVKMIGQYLLKRENNWTYTPKEALMKIGGPEVQQLALELLTANAEFARKEAVEILAAQMPKTEFLALIRKMLKEENFGDKQSALIQLAQLGTAEDLKLLEPYLDYWTADRSLHYWAMSAASAIKQRKK